MINTQRLFTVIGLAILLAIFGAIQVQAHGTEEHGSHLDAQMKKLHAMMPMFSQASAGLEKSIEHNDATAVNEHVTTMLATIPDLKKSKPHKNAKQVAEFKKIASTFGAEIAQVGSLAEKGNFVSAKEAYKRVEKACTECHARFRD